MAYATVTAPGCFGERSVVHKVFASLDAAQRAIRYQPRQVVIQMDDEWARPGFQIARDALSRIPILYHGGKKF